MGSLPLPPKGDASPEVVEISRLNRRSRTTQERRIIPESLDVEVSIYHSLCALTINK
jgi:hypothetical protein